MIWPRIFFTAGVALLAAGMVPIPAWAQTHVEMQLRDGGIQPAQITVRRGENVTIHAVNTGQQVHNLVIPDFYVFSNNLRAGEGVTVQFRPDKVGRFRYYSDRSVNGGRAPEPGMTGTLVVQ
ncbi:cupredoxin domain-containing protein [Alicyclobacillus contaminans]|uniref:cupredoxin domain-containing protein n=1 Tax=Alicyclobacillus contaminans TaxID=392016 RepID=UPI000402147B|nr:cupredoxin domain-containing protein [Alicyclobacillus contaminans]